MIDPNITCSDPVYILLTHILKSIASKPNNIEIKRVEDEVKIVYYVNAPGEEQVIIGKNGEIAKCIRVVIKCASKAANMKHVYMDVLDSRIKNPF